MISLNRSYIVILHCRLRDSKVGNSLLTTEIQFLLKTFANMSQQPRDAAAYRPTLCASNRSTSVTVLCARRLI